MTAEMICLRGARMAIECVGTSDNAGMQFIWAHGWRQSGTSFRPLAESLSRVAPSIVLDLPGFGRSPVPAANWSTADYADAISEWLNALPAVRRIWVGHSFGCRIGIQIAARNPKALSALVLIAAAGLPRKRTPLQEIRFACRVRTYKLARYLLSEGWFLDRLRRWFGSPDYNDAGPMRGIFMKVVAEDLSDVAKAIRCPALLVYGRDDTDTPPEMGERLQRLIADARLLVVDGYDHHTILTRGKHQLVQEIRRFLAYLK